MWAVLGCARGWMPEVGVCACTYVYQTKLSPSLHLITDMHVHLPRLQALRRGSRGLQRLAYSGSLQLAMGSTGGSVLAGLSSLTRLTLCNTAGPQTAGVIAQTFILGMQSGYIVHACPV